MQKLLISLSLFFTLDIIAQTPANVTLPEGTYPHWPLYKYIPDAELKTVKASEWKNTNHVIEGWDWSFPGFVTPSKPSSYGLQRVYGFDRPFINPNLQFKANAVGDLWVKWRDIEKTKDNFDFGPLLARIRQSQSIGLNISLRILCHAKARGTGRDSINRAEAPLWLDDLGCTLLPQNKPQDNLNYNPANPQFHARYLKLISEVAKAGIPGMVKNMYIGYASPAFGDEGIGPYHDDSFSNDTVPHVIERIDAWGRAFKGMESKVYMGGTSDHGFKKGFGARRGFVEMYHYELPYADLGSYIDSRGYISVDENAPLLRYKCFNGEVNEEYSPAMAAAQMEYRFGISTVSFPYRYFMSMLRTLQMRCTYVHDDGRLIPEMMPFIALELGRTVEDAPDVWSFLNTFYMRRSSYANNDWQMPRRTFTSTENQQGIEAKNYECWLYQRDAPGYETQPEEQIQQAIKMWMIQPNKYFDYIARSGKKIGFDIDNRWSGIDDTIALKVTYFDRTRGTMNLVYHNSQGKQTNAQTLSGDGKLKTATFFIPGIKANSLENNFEFALEAGANTEKIIVSMVRVVKATPSSGSVGTRPGSQDQQPDIKISYNQSNQLILVSCSTDIHQIELFDVSGRTMKKLERGNGNTFELRTHDLKAGIYILSVLDKYGKRKAEKILVSR